MIIALTIALVVTERKQVVQALPILAHAQFAVLIVTGVFEVIFFVLQALSARLLYTLYTRKVSISQLTAILLHATMVNEVFPTSGVSGTASFVYWGDRLGYGLRDTLAVNIWMTLLSYIALSPIIALSARALWLLPGTPARLISGTLILAAVFLIVTILAFLTWYKFAKRTAPKESVDIEHFDMTNALRMGYYVSQGWKVGLARLRRVSSSYTQTELSKEWSRAIQHPVRLVVCTLLLMSIYAVRVIMLSLCFMAVGITLPVFTAIYVYSLTLLFSVVSLAPTTLGVVEVAMTTALHWFGVPLPVAVAGTILYRLSSFWLPIPLGLLSQWWLTKSAGHKI